MTLRLILMRHAKSSWDDPALDDHARPLNARGRRNAAALGAWLKARGDLPDAALVSDARRTRETWECLGLEGAPRLLAELYLADAREIVHAIRRHGRGRRLLVIGHNPGIAAAAARLAALPPDHPRFADYPTGATTILDFDMDDWGDIAPGRGHPAGFAIPRELPEPT